MHLADRLRRPPAHDAVFAVLFAVAVVAITRRLDLAEDEPRAVDALGYAVVVVACTSLAWRRCFPTAVLSVTTAALAIYIARSYPGGPAHLAPVIAMYTVASCYERRRWVTAVGAAAATLALVGLLFAENDSAGVFVILYFSWAAAAGFLGDAARSRREYLEGLEERNRRLEEAHEEEARRRVAEERLRIARDLHDVVAHSLSSINIQASAGAHVAARHPEQAERALAEIKRASKEALDELRMALGTLRSSSDDETAPLAPQPSLARLEALVERTRKAGLRVDVEVRGSPVVLAGPVDAAAYRIVQEALTNTLRHANATHAVVSIVCASGSVHVEVVDDGNGAPAGGSHRAGHGLVGMRERALALGGTVEVGAAAGGGFRVHAYLPAQPGVHA